MLSTTFFNRKLTHAPDAEVREIVRSAEETLRENNARIASEEMKRLIIGRGCTNDHYENL